MGDVIHKYIYIYISNYKWYIYIYITHIIDNIIIVIFYTVDPFVN
jgi:hypothetical protein